MMGHSGAVRSVVYSPNGKIYHNNYDNWQPRVGLAYRLGQKTAIRASFGVFFDNWAGNTQTSENYVGTWPDVGIEIANNLNNQLNVSAVPNTKATNPFPNGITGVFPAPDPFSQVTWFADPYIKNPYSMQWNFGVQHQLNNSTVVNVNYVGSGSRRLDLGGYYNTALTPGPGNPQLRAPFPWAAPTYYDHSWGRSNYESLQFLLDKKFTNGFAFMVSYTWSKAMTYVDSDSSGVAIYRPVRVWNYGKASFDQTHVLVFNYTWDLPKASRVIPGSVAHWVLDDWRLSGVTSFASGNPLGISLSTVDGADITGGGDGVRVNVLGKAQLDHGARTQTRWFDPTVFGRPVKGDPGNAPKDVFRGPGVNNFDATLFKIIPLGKETRTLQLRWEAYNAFNHTQFLGVDNGARFDAAGNQVNARFGQVISARAPRVMQVSLRFAF